MKLQYFREIYIFNTKPRLYYIFKAGILILTWKIAIHNMLCYPLSCIPLYTIMLCIRWGRLKMTLNDFRSQHDRWLGDDAYAIRVIMPYVNPQTKLDRP